MLQVVSLHLNHSSYIKESTQDSAILDFFQCNNALWTPTKEILQTTAYDEEQVSESVVTKLASLIL